MNFLFEKAKQSCHFPSGALKSLHKTSQFIWKIYFVESVICFSYKGNIKWDIKFSNHEYLLGSNCPVQSWRETFEFKIENVEINPKHQNFEEKNAFSSFSATVIKSYNLQFYTSMKLWCVWKGNHKKWVYFWVCLNP